MFLLHLFPWPEDKLAELPLVQLVLAVTPLLVCVMAMGLSQFLTWTEPGDVIPLRPKTTLQELQARLRGAIRVDRAVRIRLSAAGCSFCWACACLSDTMLDRRRVTEQAFDPVEYDRQLSYAEYLHYMSRYTKLTGSTTNRSDLLHHCKRDCNWAPAKCSDLLEACDGDNSLLKTSMGSPVSDKNHYGTSYINQINWVRHGSMSCQTYVDAAEPFVMMLSLAVAQCIKRDECRAVVCAAGSETTCTLRASNRLDSSASEDCYLPSESPLPPRLPPPPPPPHRPSPPPTPHPPPPPPSSDVHPPRSPPRVATPLTIPDPKSWYGRKWYGEYGLFAVSTLGSNAGFDGQVFWIQAASSGGSGSVEVVFREKWDPGLKRYMPRGISRPDTLTRCETFPQLLSFGSSSPFCLQYELQLEQSGVPNAARIPHPDDVGGRRQSPRSRISLAPLAQSGHRHGATYPLHKHPVSQSDCLFSSSHRPLPYVFGALAPFCLLLALRPIDMMLVRFSCLFLVGWLGDAAQQLRVRTFADPQPSPDAANLRSFGRGPARGAGVCPLPLVHPQLPSGTPAHWHWVGTACRP